MQNVVSPKYFNRNPYAKETFDEFQTTQCSDETTKQKYIPDKTILKLDLLSLMLVARISNAIDLAEDLMIIFLYSWNFTFLF